MPALVNEFWGIKVVSAIIVNYHTSQMACKAVASILNSPIETEVIVIDNSVYEKESESLRALLPLEVKIIVNPTNIGFAKACNQAYQISKGEHILLLNPDAYLLEGALERMTGFLINNPQAGAVGPRIYWDDGKRFILPINYIPKPLFDIVFAKYCGIPLITHLYSLIWRQRFLKAIFVNRPLRQECLSGGSVLIRRSAIEACGGLFDEEFFMYYEDADLFLRLAKKGYKLYLDNTAEVVHHWNQSPEIDVTKDEILIRSHSRYMQKNFRHIQWLYSRLTILMPLQIDRRCNNMINFEPTQDMTIQVPKQLQHQWVFEWSHNPNLFPAVMTLGTGKEFVFNKELFRLFKKGTYYGRISDPKAFYAPPPNIRWQIH